MDPMIAYCGVYCSACPDYESGKCPSCRLSEWEKDDICMPVRCCREKEIECCACCGSFPCADMASFYEESPSHRTAYERMLALRATETDRR